MDTQNAGRDSAPLAAESGALGSNTKFVFRAEKAVEKYYLLSLAKDLLPDTRIRICMSHLMPGKTGVDVNYNHKYRYAWFTNLQRCGCSWVCAFCTSRKSEHDRNEIAYHVTNNMTKYIPIMVTLTMGHKRDDRLGYLLNGLMGAYRKMQQGKDWKLLVEDYALIGTIRALEITYSRVNGWHPHFHVLWLLDKSALDIDGIISSNVIDEPEAIEEIAYSLRNHLSTHYWRPSLVELGYYATDERGVEVTVGHKEILDYVSKYGYVPEEKNDRGWGIESEMTRGASKRAGNDSMTSWDLLRAFGDGDKACGSLFKEFAIATKGKNQLRWSPGLRDRLQVVDVPENDVLYEELPVDDLLLYIRSEQWAVVRRNRAQGNVIRIASSGIAIDLMKYLNSLPGMKEAGEWWIPKGR